MSNLDMTPIITVLAGVILVLQSVYIALALKKGWTIRVKPIWLLLWAILLVGGIYSMITGNRFIQ